MIGRINQQSGTVGRLYNRVARGAEVTEFSPLDIADCILWADFADITTLYQDDALTVPVTADGNAIGGIMDKSTANNHHIQANTALRPVYKAGVWNGLSVSRHDGDILRREQSLSPTSFTVFSVSLSASTGDRTIYSWEATNLIRHQIATNFLLRMRSSTGTMRQFSISTGVLSKAILTTRWNGSSFEGWRNNISGGAALTDTGTLTLTNSRIGGEASDQATFAYIGDVGEVLFYNRALTEDERGAVQTYLNAKWAVY